jgi:hypothetical protein
MIAIGIGLLVLIVLDLLALRFGAYSGEGRDRTARW